MEERLLYLMNKVISQKSIPAEHEELMELIQHPAIEKKFKEGLINHLNSSVENKAKLQDPELEHILFSIFNTSKNQPTETQIGVKAKVFHLRKWQKIAAAALVILSIGIGVFQYNKSGSELTAKQTPVIKNDLPPGGNKATLTLSNGQVIVLDEAGKGLLASESSTEVLKKENGLLEYKETGDNNKAIVYNTIATPNGGEYQIVLSDGTKVWLNAASSLYYPTSFEGKDRVVELKGEGYFEVVHNASQPFKVKVGDQVIEDVGTGFNINAYTNEPGLKATLVEGAIEIYASENVASKTKVIAGQQVFCNNSDYKISAADVEEAIAWKKGEFNFKSLNIDAVMRQIARWYDISYEYKNEKPDGHFTGILKRNTPISTVLKMLEYNGVKCEIEGKKVVVM